VSSIQKKHIIVLCVSSLAVLAYYQNYVSFDWLNTVASYISYPVLVFQKSVIEPWHARALNKQTVHDLEAQLQHLKNQYQHMCAENISLRVSQKYQHDIYDLIDFKQRYNPTFGVVAQVLTRHAADDGHYFLVAAGEQKGVKLDMVAVYKSFLVGKVTEVHPWYAKVSLITDERCKIAAYCEKTNACGIHEGCNRANATTLNFVSHLDTIEQDELVVSSGKGLVFPQGFALGRIKTITQQDLFHAIEVEPLIDLYSLDYCLIIDKGTVEAAG
jgi:rod shape-determining protein MreC